MKHVVVSPHHDDAIFSLGETLLGLIDAGHQVSVATPMAGTPWDDRGTEKAFRLGAEHRDAVRRLGAHELNGRWLDDCYEESHDGLAEWIEKAASHADVVWAPVGIHHPDHLTVAQASYRAWKALGRLPQLRVYEELPYRVLYPSHAIGRLEHWREKVGPIELLGYPSHQLERKRRIVTMYESQMGEDVERNLFVPERAWRVEACG